jgi:hypothetical protein
MPGKIHLGTIRPISEFLVSAIDRPLEQKYIQNLDISSQMLEAVREQCFHYEEQFIPGLRGRRTPDRDGVEQRFYPLRSDTELWPAVFRQRVAIKDGDLRPELYHYSNNLYPLVKKILLFCHGVFIDPPRFIFPDKIFSFDDCVRHTRFTLEGLASIAPLLARKIVVPAPPDYDPGSVTGEFWSKYPGKFKPSKETKEQISMISQRLMRNNPGVAIENAERAVIQALLDQNATHQRGRFFDPFFHDSLEARAFGEILYHLDAHLTSSMKLEPIVVHKLTSNFGVHADKISALEIESMRDNHELFAAWRQILSGALNHLAANENNYRDPSKELQEYLSENQAKWREQADKLTGRGFLSTIVDGSQKVAGNVVSGVLAGGLIDPAQGAVIGGMAAAVSPILQLFAQIPKSLAGTRDRSILRNHFLAVGAKL